MTDPSQQNIDDATQATIQLHNAMIVLGAQTMKDSIALYSDVPPIPNASTASATAKWLTAAVAGVMLKRARAQAIALAYYRYERALLTGRTIALPGQEQETTLDRLKFEFMHAVNPQITSYTPGSNSTPIPVDHIDGLDAALSSLETEAEAQTTENLQVLGPQNQDYNVRQIKSTPETASHVVDSGRVDAHSRAGKRQAAAAERNAMNGARGPLYLVSSKDTAAMGWVRVSTTGTPCGFCAMLISRGVVYRSAQTAGDQDLYHDNCHCIAVPVFSMKQYENNPLFSLNREYDELWQKNIAGKYSGSYALTKWRALLRKRAQSQKTQVAAAA